MHIYHPCSLKSARTKRSALANASVLTWRRGIHLHDAYATLWDVPNEVANCWFDVMHRRPATSMCAPRRLGVGRACDQGSARISRHNPER